jgi:rhamnosyltransferase
MIADVGIAPETSFGSTVLEQTGLIIPTFNAAAYFPALDAMLKKQGLDPKQILFIDSCSEDATAKMVAEAGYSLWQIEKKDFRHGTTRAAALNYFPDAAFLIYLTQDALPTSEDTIRRLLDVFEDPGVGSAYGRQIARPVAGPIERHARMFNYPETSEIRDYSMRVEKGFRTAFHSNSFAAYRKSAMEEVGGFQNTIVSEEVSLVARMLLAGWRNAYVADAQVIHSHNLTLSHEFSRYFDIGVHHNMERWIIDQFGDVGGEGRNFIVSETRYLWSVDPALVPLAFLHNALKWLGYRTGVHSHWLPISLRRSLSGQPTFWQDEQTAHKEENSRAAARIA